MYCTDTPLSQLQPTHIDGQTSQPQIPDDSDILIWSLGEDFIGKEILKITKNFGWKEL